MKPQHVPGIAAILPSLLVALAHFTFSARVGPYANVIFQRWIDTGERASGADAVVVTVYALFLLSRWLLNKTVQK